MADTGDSEPENKYPNRPKDTAFRQQRLPACQPVLTPYSVLPVFFAVGIAFIPLGVWIFNVADGIIEIDLDYTGCSGDGYLNGTKVLGKVVCADLLAKNPGNATCECRRTIIIPEPGVPVPSLFYYGLTNYYQNHRLYAKSRNDQQLRGKLDAQDGCAPYASSNSSLPVVPCGALANSLFNDSFQLVYNKGSTEIPVNVTKKGIAWPSDKAMRFNNPPIVTNLSDAFARTQHPQNWQKDILSLDRDIGLNDTDNVGLKNEDLIVWMRTAAFPNFRKLYRKVAHDAGDPLFAKGLPAGNYTLIIIYNYPVTQFSGTKHFVVTTVSWLGGKNYFLGYVYIIVGAFALAAGLLLLILFIKFGKKTKDLINITTSTPYYE